MSTVASLEDFKRIAAECERREQVRNGGTREEARVRVARRAGVSPGTLYTLARDRLKRFDVDLRNRLTAYAIKDLHNEIGRLSHELDVARQMGAHPLSGRVEEIESHLNKARALLTEAAGER